VHPADREYVDSSWEAGLAGEPYDIEHRIVVNGQIKWVREKAYLEFDTAGGLLGGFGITQDITHRKLAEEQIANIAKFPPRTQIRCCAYPVMEQSCTAIRRVRLSWSDGAAKSARRRRKTGANLL